MNALLEFVAWNSLVAVVLAFLVVLAGRVWNRPELLHLLWLVVLVKLVTPGVVQWAALPDVIGAAPQPLAVAVVDTLPPDEMLAAVPVVEHAHTWGWTQTSATIWIGGSALLLMLVLGRCVRFARAMRSATPAGRELSCRIGRLAGPLGLGSSPRTLVIEATVPPMVWGGVRGSTLVLPAGLLDKLDDDEIDTLITHELAHVKRRDPWVRWVELVVTGALWWNPLVWWVRKRLRHAEEQACDRRVLEAFPHAHRAYADGIVKTVEFLAGSGRTPQFVTGAVGTRHIKERLIMILNPSSNRRFRHPLVPALLLAILVLPVVPGFAERDDRDAEEARAELLALQREALELEQRLQQIKVEQDQLRMRLGETHSRAEAVEARRQVEELRRRGKVAEAAEVEAKLAQVEMERARELALQAELMDRDRRMRDAELEMRETLIEYERALAEHKRALAEESVAHHEAQEMYERALRKQHQDQVHAELDELASRYEELREAGREEEADELAIMMEKLHLRRQAVSLQVRAQLDELHMVLEQSDDDEDRDALKRKIETLTKKLQELERREERGRVR